MVSVKLEAVAAVRFMEKQMEYGRGKRRTWTVIYTVASYCLSYDPSRIRRRRTRELNI
jgi:hypothetical protein